MKATGIVRRIDDLGRVVIPKEIRRTLRIKEGAPLEIFTDREGEIILKKYSPIGELGNFAKEYADALSQVSGHSVYITDHDQIVAVSGGIKKENVGKAISKQLEHVIMERQQVLANADLGTNIQILSDSPEDVFPQAICPILSEGDAIGAVVLTDKDTDVQFGETEQLLARCAALFMGRQMEQ